MLTSQTDSQFYATLSPCSCVHLDRLIRIVEHSPAVRDALITTFAFYSRVVGGDILHFFVRTHRWAVLRDLFCFRSFQMP